MTQKPIQINDQRTETNIIQVIVDSIVATLFFIALTIGTVAVLVLLDPVMFANFTR